MARPPWVPLLCISVSYSGLPGVDKVGGRKTRKGRVYSLYFISLGSVSRLLGTTRGLPEPYWVRKGTRTNIKSYYSHLTRPLRCMTLFLLYLPYRVRDKVGEDLSSTGRYTIGSYNIIMGSHILGPVRRKDQGSRRHVHPVSVRSKVGGTHRKDSESLDLVRLRSDDSERRIDIQYLGTLNTDSHETEWFVLPSHVGSYVIRFQY